MQRVWDKGNKVDWCYSIRLNSWSIDELQDIMHWFSNYESSYRYKLKVSINDIVILFEYEVDALMFRLRF